MNETERQALAERIASIMFGENRTTAWQVRTVQAVVDLLDAEDRLTEPVKLSDLWTNGSASREEISRLADEVETWDSVMAYLRSPLGPEKIKAIRAIRILVDSSGGSSHLRTVRDVVDTICDRHGWNRLAWKGKS